MVLDDAWVVVTRNEREWLTAQGYGDATHDLSHPAIGSQFVIVGMDSMGWLQVLSVQAWLHTRMDLAIWIHPGVVRAFRPDRVVYTLARDTEAPNGCRVTDLQHLLQNPDADAATDANQDKPKKKKATKKKAAAKIKAKKGKD